MVMWVPRASIGRLRPACVQTSNKGSRWSVQRASGCLNTYPPTPCTPHTKHQRRTGSPQRLPTSNTLYFPQSWEALPIRDRAAPPQQALRPNPSQAHHTSHHNHRRSQIQQHGPLNHYPGSIHPGSRQERQLIQAPQRLRMVSTRRLLQSNPPRRRYLHRSQQEACPPSTLPPPRRRATLQRTPRRRPQQGPRSTQSIPLLTSRKPKRRAHSRRLPRTRRRAARNPQRRHPLCHARVAIRARPPRRDSCRTGQDRRCRWQRRSRARCKACTRA